MDEYSLLQKKKKKDKYSQEFKVRKLRDWKVELKSIVLSIVGSTPPNWFFFYVHELKIELLTNTLGV